jgi:hypothetical protein
MKRGHFFDYYYSCMVFVLPVIWLLFTFHIPMAIIIGDSCDLIELAQKDPVGVLYWENQTATILQACLTNASLTDAFNLSVAINVGAVALPSFDTSSLFPTEVNDLLTSIKALDASDFSSTDPQSLLNTFNAVCKDHGWKCNGADCTLSTLKSNPPPAVNRQTCTTGGANIEVDDAAKQANGILTAVAAKAALENSVTQMKAKATALESEISTLKTNLNDANTKITSLGTAMNALITRVQSLISLAYCGSIGTHWETFMYSMCTTMSSSLSLETLCFWMVGWITVAQLPLAVKLANACGHNAVDSEGDDFTAPPPPQPQARAGGKKKGKGKGKGRRKKKANYETDEDEARIVRRKIKIVAYD